MNDIFKDMQAKIGCEYISDLPSYKRQVWQGSAVSFHATLDVCKRANQKYIHSRFLPAYP